MKDKYKYKYLDKFPEKYLVWQAICSCGLRTTPYITKGTLNAKGYLENCLKKTLLPFMRKQNSPVIFWPDLASCHFAKEVKEWYEKEGVHVVPRECNPPNSPEIRPIEKYWAIVKRKLLEDGAVVDSIPAFRRKWNKHAATISKKVVRKLMAGICSKVRRLIRGYVLV